MIIGSEEILKEIKKVEKQMQMKNNLMIKEILEDILKHGHGGGNWRRLIILKISEIESEECFCICHHADKMFEHDKKIPIKCEHCDKA